MSETGERPRIAAFRRALVGAIPRFPNNRASREALEKKGLTDLLIIYLSWRLRFVAPRPRTVSGRQTLASDSRAAALDPMISDFLAKVEAGDDLTPYLSLEPRTRGYTPDAQTRGASADSWADKDFLLNVMGLHHFHLEPAGETKGSRQRTNEMLFASVTRYVFEIVGLFYHSTFDRLDDDTMTPERTRLWTLYDQRREEGALPGQLRLDGFGGLGLVTSGHPLAVVRTAQDHARLIRQIDRLLDDPAELSKFYPDGKLPARPKPQWHYSHLDLGLADERAGVFMRLTKGPN